MVRFPHICSCGATAVEQLVNIDETSLFLSESYPGCFSYCSYEGRVIKAEYTCRVTPVKTARYLIPSLQKQKIIACKEWRNVSLRRMRVEQICVNTLQRTGHNSIISGGVAVPFLIGSPYRPRCRVSAPFHSLFNVESAFMLRGCGFAQIRDKSNWLPISSIWAVSQTVSCISLPSAELLYRVVFPSDTVGWVWYRIHLNLLLLVWGGFVWAKQHQSHYRGCYQRNPQSSLRLLSLRKNLWASAVLFDMQ